MKIAGILNSDNYMEFSLRVDFKTAEIVAKSGQRNGLWLVDLNTEISSDFK